MSVIKLIVVAIAAFVLAPLLRIVLAAVFGRAIGAAALARQPDAIHLERLPDDAGRPDRARRLAAEYLSLGFEDAGRYAIPEMRGVKVQLFAHVKDSMYGAVYEHPAAGVWADVVNRYADGSAWTFTSSRPTGLQHRPNTRMLNQPGADARTLVERTRSERPAFGLKSVSVGTAVGDFERAYAEYMAWMKQRGISTREAVDVARRKAA